MNCDDSDREVILRSLQRVLDRNVMRALSMFRREVPAPGPELDPGEAPQRTGAPRLVPILPFTVFLLEESAGHLSTRGGRERVRERLRPLPNELLAPDGICEVVNLHREVARSLGLPQEPFDYRQYRPSPAAEDVVVELVGDRKSFTRVRKPAHVASRPRKTTVDRRAKRRPRARLAKSLLEQRDGTIDALQLGKKDQDVGPQRSDGVVAQELLGDCPRPRPLSCTTGGRALPRALERSAHRGRPQGSAEALARRALPPRPMHRAQMRALAASSSSDATSRSAVSRESARCRARRSGSSRRSASRA